MERITLSFPSVFDLHDFKKKIDTTHTEARVNHLTGCFSTKELEIALTEFHAELLKEFRD
jgi:hypothetical protein